MLRIAIDMDEVIADTLAMHLSEYNRKFGAALTRDDMLGTKLRWLRPEHAGEARAILDQPQFFRKLEVMPGCQEVIAELNERFEVFIATAAMEVPSSFHEKYEWLKEHFPFLDDMNFVFCGDKGIVHADYLIDDNPRHFERFRGTGLLFDAPHNAEETRYIRVKDWSEVKAYFSSMK
ncbi:5' nucleotidase, NT5C type [Paenibacillus sp. YYML68]|uniref:5' nucleotidase, NT5C type n=1 Tax=Paenibacillus sp. YYML68 TaxID=2909250 RepID=UPI002493687D|nr:5'-3'-deoxyribonucleotidase [Paenibacillus sp. YYML68]